MRISYLTTLLIIVALLASGCSDGDDTEAVASLEDTATEAPETAEAELSTEEEAEAAMLDFTQCLREQGVDVGDPTMGADGNLQLPPIEVSGEFDPEDDPDVMMAQMDAVFAECDQHLAGITLGAPDPGANVAFEDAFVEYAGCMRDHGIDMPDPDFSGDGGMMIELGSPTAGDQAEFDAAHEECEPILAGIGIDF